MINRYKTKKLKTFRIAFEPLKYGVINSCTRKTRLNRMKRQTYIAKKHSRILFAIPIELNANFGLLTFHLLYYTFPYILML